MLKYPILLPHFTRLGLALVVAFAAGCQSKESAAPQPAAASANSTITTFRHPGVLDTQESLDLVGSQANAGNTARLDAYAKVVEYMNANPVPISFPEIVNVGAASGSTTEDQMRRDAILAYACALRWAKTGNATYATQAKQILNGWAYNFQSYETDPTPDDDNQPYLEAAWVAPSFTAAAEIIRHYRANGTTNAGWSSTDIAKFSDFLNNLKNNYINNIPQYGHRSNWRVSYCYAKMAIGVFLDSKTVYDSGYDYALANMSSFFRPLPDGSPEELYTREDCHHAQYTLTGLTYAAEIARNQGNNTAMYEHNSRQIEKGWERMEDALANSLNPARDCSGAGDIFGSIETAHNYYQSSKLQTLRNRLDPYGVTGGKTFLGFNTYTHRGIGR